MSRRRSGPRNAADRVKHLLVMLPWLMEEGEVPLADVAARFDMTESEVVADLELVAMCGLPPYVDEMVDVFVDEGMVYVGVPRLFTRPLRLTAPEGFALLATARTALELPGSDPDGPLARGLAKLSDTLGRAGLDAPGGDDTAGVAVDLERPDAVDEIVAAVAGGSELRIDYFSPSRAETSRRVVVPRHVFVDAGNWYLVADDERSGQRRTFRIDRVESFEPTGVVHHVDPSVDAPDAFFTDADLPTATLRVRPAARWIIERYPTVSVTESAENIEVELAVSSDRWLHRLLVRLGPDAEVVSPPEAADGARALASRILANYET